MPNSPEPGTARRSCGGCWLYGAVIFFGLPTLLLMTLALVFMGREQSARRQLQAKLAERVAQDLPIDNATLGDLHDRSTSAADTAAWYAVLDTITSAEYEQSMRGVPTLDASEGVSESFPAPGGAWPERQATLAFLEKWSDLESEVHRLASQQLTSGSTPVRFDIEFDSFDTILQHVQHMRSVARFLRVAGERAVYFDRPEDLLRSIESLLGTSDTIRGDPFLVPQLVRIAIDGIAIQLLQRSLEHDVLGEPELQRLLPLLLARTQIGNEWQLAIHGEIAGAMPIFAEPARIDNEIAVVLPARSRDALMYLDHMTAILDVPVDDLTQFQTSCQALEDDLSTKLRGGTLPNFDGILTGMMAPAIASAAEAFIRRVTLNRLAAIAVAIRLHQKQNGSFPESLDDLEPLGIDLKQLSPPGADRFGYAVDDTGGVLWGYDFTRENAIPPTPPARPAEGEESYEAAMQRLWTWWLREEPRKQPVTSSIDSND